MYDAVSEGAIGKITQIEYISNIRTAAGRVHNTVLVFCDYLCNATAHNAKAEQGNRQLFVLHRASSLTCHMGMHIVYHIFIHLVNNFLEKIEKV